jgi:hypothetical protein
MRNFHRWPVVAAFVALTGCGNRVPIKPDPATQGAAVSAVGHLTGMCVNGGPALALTLGWSSCDASATIADPSYIFTISKGDYPLVASGSSFVLVADPKSITTGLRMTGTAGAPLTPRTIGQATQTLMTGVLTFDTFEADRAATGNYDVAFPGGAASGTFSADFCTPSPIACR